MKDQAVILAADHLKSDDRTGTRHEVAQVVVVSLDEAYEL